MFPPNAEHDDTSWRASWSQTYAIIQTVNGLFVRIHVKLSAGYVHFPFCDNVTKQDIHGAVKRLQ